MSHFLISNVLQVGYTIKLEDKILAEMNLFASSKSYFGTIKDGFCRSRCFSQSIFIWCWQWYLWLTRLCQAPFQVLSPTKNKTKQKKKRGTVAIRIGRRVFCEENIMLYFASQNRKFKPDGKFRNYQRGAKSVRNRGLWNSRRMGRIKMRNSDREDLWLFKAQWAVPAHWLCIISGLHWLLSHTHRLSARITSQPNHSALGLLLFCFLFSMSRCSFH